MPPPMAAPQMAANTAIKKPASGAQYYKDVMAAVKEVKNAVKKLRVNKVEDALEDLRKVTDLLQPYAQN